MKIYYSCLDTGFVKYASQPLQHLANNNKANNLGGKIIFYTSEDFKSLASHGVIKAKLKEQGKKVNGVIFFTIRQFFYGGKLNLKFLGEMIKRGYEVHFSRENISIFDQNDLDEVFPMLYVSQFVIQRDETKNFIKNVIDKIDKENDFALQY